MDNKLYEFTIREYNSEQEYNHDCYVWAKNEEQANELAHDYALNWYQDDDDEENETTFRNNHFENDFASWRLYPAREFECVYISPINGKSIRFELKDGIEE